MMVQAALREPDERQARRCAPTEQFGVSEGGLGTVDIAEATSDLTELGVAGGGMRRADAGQLSARPDDLLFGSLPLASALQRPGVVDPAQSREHGQRVAVGPAARGVGPLGRAAE